MVLIFKAINDKLIIDFILKFAGITYGPLLGLFSFGILTKRHLNHKLIWTVCIIAPLIALGLDVLSSPEWYEKKLHFPLGLKSISASIFNGYKIGNELILINGIFTFLGLLLISKKGDNRKDISLTNSSASRGLSYCVITHWSFNVKPIIYCCTCPIGTHH